VGEEWVVLVDDDDRELGTAVKREVHHARTPLHRGVSLFLFDRRGRTLLQRRSLAKRTWPGAWSNACCGHPAPGEAAEAAVRRRCREELGIEPRDLALVLPDFRYRAESGGVVENELCPVFVARVDGEPLSPDPAEVAETRWIDWRRFLAELPGDYSPWSAEEARELAASPAFAAWRDAAAPA
jgi:isopentenyl-diphosphate delta-isomerase type 1